MKSSHVATVSPVEDRLFSQPYDHRENFDSVPPQEIPDEGLALDFVTIRCGSVDANRMRIDLCAYADYSDVVDRNVLQSVALHDTVDIRVDFAHPCTDVFFTIFAYPRFTVETTLQFHGADDAVLKEHIGGTLDSDSYAEQLLARARSAAGSHVLNFTISPVLPVAPDAEGANRQAEGWWGHPELVRR